MVCKKFYLMNNTNIGVLFFIVKNKASGIDENQNKATKKLEIIVIL